MTAMAPLRPSATPSRRARTQGAEHRTDKHRDDRATAFVVPRQLVSQPVGQTQHPLTHGHVGPHLIDQVGGALGHPMATATRTDRAALAREGDEAVEGAIVAMKPGKPTGEPPAPEHVAKLLLDEPRQAFPVAQTGCLGAEGLEILAHDLIDRALGGPARFVSRRGRGHCRPEGGCRASEVLDEIGLNATARALGVADLAVLRACGVVVLASRGTP